MIAHKTKAAMPGRLSLNALLKHFKITRLAAGGQRMSQLNFEYADFIQDFVLARMGAPGILRGFNTEVQTSTGRLAYGHHNPLKKNQDGNSRLAQNILNLLNLRNCRGMREPPNPLNHLDYNDSLELANWLILFNSVELTDLDNPLITPRNADGVVRLPQIEVLERINNLVTDGYLVHGSATIGSWRGDAFLYHEENQQSPALDCEPDLAYERVVPQSNEVNRLYLSEPDSQPSLRGEPLHNSLRVTQNKPSLRGLVNYEILVVQKSTCKNFVGHSANENSPVQAKKKGRIPNPTLCFMLFQLSYLISDTIALTTQYEEYAVATKKITAIASRHLHRVESGITHASGSALDFLRCSDLSLRPQASSTHAEKLAPEFSAFSRSTLASISSTNSYGNLIPLYADLLFLCPVAIEDDSCWCFNTRENKSSLQICEVFKYFWLDAFKHLDIRYLNTLSTAKAQVRHKNSEARRCDNTNGPLTTNVSVDNEAAMNDHITHPQGRNNYIWRFLALNRHDKKATPCRLSVEAATERDARRILAPHFILSLAARLPVSEVRHA
ncbi:Uncharacterised protein [Klebsiella quasipneumoniae]|uniref:host cell division inhibitor Icd-like protein n=1 Tax=Klebsiella quasipneumoniae TaxID=1463165 RepID=UPI0010BA1352|nr:Uncharacterised protein [Klebsiella quasipneumoniae]VGE05603.1 Uncharacterised protein [Klebsiella quasipneumoniae]VGE05755.1 Uncharacterised protein [Klebsiella quasipneumoniae]VGE09609.1 Uncharacterised protein [Klebsiella quasipneumoniae]VGE14933.1 Uncharacterised protein [Klebsiella quasipneumoniae]